MGFWKRQGHVPFPQKKAMRYQQHQFSEKQAWSVKGRPQTKKEERKFECLNPLSRPRLKMNSLRVPNQRNQRNLFKKWLDKLLCQKNRKMESLERCRRRQRNHRLQSLMRMQAMVLLQPMIVTASSLAWRHLIGVSRQPNHKLVGRQERRFGKISCHRFLQLQGPNTALSG